MLAAATATMTAVSLSWRFNCKLVILHNPFDGRCSTGQGCRWVALFFVILMNINVDFMRKGKNREGRRGKGRGHREGNGDDPSLSHNQPFHVPSI